jgi:hypothetical protein
MPKGLIPQDYFVTYYLQSEDGTIVSNKRFHTYFIKGLVGSIESAEFDKAIYKNGDDLNIIVNSFVYNKTVSLSPMATGTLSVTVKNSSGDLCSENMMAMVSPEVTVSVLSSKVTRTCKNPTAHIVLSSKDENGNEKVLDTKDIGIITPAKYLPNYLLYIVIILIIVLMVWLVIRYIKKNKANAILKSSTVAILLALSFFGLSKDASAISCFPNPSDATAGCANGYCGYFMCESTKDPVKGGDDGDFYWSDRTVSYYGIGNGGFVMWPKGNYNGHVLRCV